MQMRFKIARLRIIEVGDNRKLDEWGGVAGLDLWDYCGWSSDSYVCMGDIYDKLRNLQEDSLLYRKFVVHEAYAAFRLRFKLPLDNKNLYEVRLIRCD